MPVSLYNSQKSERHTPKMYTLIHLYTVLCHGMLTWAGGFCQLLLLTLCAVRMYVTDVFNVIITTLKSDA